MSYHKKILCIVLLGFFVLGTYSHADLIDLANCTPKKFKVTSYYSPLQGQDFYYRGNYQDEVILNGQGTHGASGRPVFNGMIAAPSSYEFGTKIYFPDFGIGQVEDRGGAIVAEGERGELYDRIDFWVGAGEEGLQRALSFGVKYLDAYVCDQPTSDHVGFNMDKFPILQNFFAQSLWMMQLERGRTDPWVEVLQKSLAELGYFPAERVTGFFGPVTEESVCAFQQDALGIAADSIRCGYFGAQTRSALYVALQNQGVSTQTVTAAVDDDTLALADQGEPEEIIVEEPIIEEAEDIIDDSVETTADVATDAIEPTLSDAINQYYLSIGDTRRYQFLNPIRLGDATKEVKLLQRKLQWLGYLDTDVSGIYDTTTKQAVYSLQLDHGVLQGDEDPSLYGYFGPQTRSTINRL